MTPEMRAKMTIGFLAMVVWGALVASGMAPADPFVSALRDLAMGVGLIHVATTPKGK